MQELGPNCGSRVGVGRRCLCQAGSALVDLGSEPGQGTEPWYEIGSGRSRERVFCFGVSWAKPQLQNCNTKRLK